MANLIQYGTFDTSTVGWTATNCTKASVNGEAEIVRPTLQTGLSANIQTSAIGAITPDKYYKLSFEAYSSVAGANLAIRMVTVTSPIVDYYSPSVQFSLTTTKKSYSFEFKSPATAKDAKLILYLNSVATYKLDNIVLDLAGATPTGNASFSSKPTARIFIDGIDTLHDTPGTTSTLTIYGILAGAHSYELRCSVVGYVGSKSGTFNALGGQTITVPHYNFPVTGLKPDCSYTIAEV